MGQSADVLRAMALSGGQVRNPRGETLGTIEDFALELRSGRVAYAVLSFGGVLGIGRKLFAVEPQALTFDESGDGFVLDVDRRTLQRASGFEKGDWPDKADPLFAAGRGTGRRDG